MTHTNESKGSQTRKAHCNENELCKKFNILIYCRNKCFTFLLFCLCQDFCSQVVWGLLGLWFRLWEFSKQYLGGVQDQLVACILSLANYSYEAFSGVVLSLTWESSPRTLKNITLSNVLLLWKLNTTISQNILD